jgi:hypothetical protein
VRTAILNMATKLNSADAISGPRHAGSHQRVSDLRARR